MKEIIFENVYFFFGILVAEILSPQRNKSFTEELAFIFFVVAVGSIIFQKNYLLFGSRYYFSFFVGFVSTYVSNFIISSYFFLFREIKHYQRKSALKKLKNIKKKLREELKSIGWKEERIDLFIRRVF